MSRAVRDLVELQASASSFVDGGEQPLKNIARPVRVYRVHGRRGASAAAAGPASASAEPASPAPPTPVTTSEMPSIAVLPFQNLTAEPDQDYFADGVVDDIINGLSRYRSLLFVIARNSTFTYKGRTVDVKQVGRELNVRYLLEGNVRRSGNRLRIGGQLIDATTALQIWSDRFEGDISDIFALQDQVAESVVGALVPQVRQAEMNRARRAPTGSVDSHLAYMQALGFFHTWSRDGVDKALQLAYRAIELDPDYATPYGLALTCFTLRRSLGWSARRAGARRDAAHGRPRRCDRARQLLCPGRGGLCRGERAGRARARGRLHRPIPCPQSQRVGRPGPERVRAHLAGRARGRDPPAATRHAQQPGRCPDVLHADGHGGGPLHGRARRRGLRLGREGVAAQSLGVAGHPDCRGQRGVAGPAGGRHQVSVAAAPARPGPAPVQLVEHVAVRRPEHFERLADGLRKAGLPE